MFHGASDIGEPRPGGCGDSASGSSGGGVAPTVAVQMNVGWKLSDVLETARWVQVRPPVDVTDIVMPVPRPVPPAATIATTTAPTGGVKLTVVMVAAVSVEASAGLDASTAGVVPPEASTSYAHQFEWSDPAGVDPAPYVSAVPEVTVPV